MDMSRSFCPPIDHLMGGLPIGAVELTAGESGLGKTELGVALSLLAQKGGYPSLYLDYGGNVNRNQILTRANAWGVSPDGLVISRPIFGGTLEAIEDTDLKLIVIDDLPSVALADEDPTIAARRIVRLLLMGCPNATLLLVNQVRYTGTRYGSYLDTFLSKVCNVRLSLSPAGILRDKASMIGHRLKLTAHFPQTQMEDKVATIYHTYAQGIDPEMNTLSTGVKMGLVEKKGEHYSYNGISLGQGLLLASRGLKRQNLLGKLLEDECQPKKSTIMLDH